MQSHVSNGGYNKEAGHFLNRPSPSRLYVCLDGDFCGGLGVAGFELDGFLLDCPGLDAITLPWLVYDGVIISRYLSPVLSSGNCQCLNHLYPLCSNEKWLASLKSPPHLQYSSSPFQNSPSWM